MMTGIIPGKKKRLRWIWTTGALFLSAAFFLLAQHVTRFRTGILVAFTAILMIVGGIIAWNRALARQARLRTGELEKELAERKRMEKELERARDELEKRIEERTTELAETVQETLLSQFCIDKAAIGIYQSTFEGDILGANDFTCRSLGYTADELRALKVFDIDPAVTHEKMLEIKKMLDARGSATFETVHRRKDGITFPVEITVNKLEFQGKLYAYSFVKDITGQKRAEEALRRAKDEWERTFASVPDLISILDDEHRIMRVNEAMAKRLGFRPDECVGLLCYEAIHGLSHPPEFCPHARTLRDGTKHSVEVYDERLGGDLLVSTTPLDDARGVMIGSVHIAYDITERKRAEEKLLDSKEKYRSIVDAYDGLIYICSRNYRVEFMNRKLIERTGCDATGRLCYEVFHNRDSVCTWCVNDRVFAGETVYWEMQSPRDGRWYYVVNVPIHNSNGTTSKHSVMTDITDLKTNEEMLRQQKRQLEELNVTLEKMVREEVAKNREKDIMLIQQNHQAALGELLDHIAHQWKQPLNSISLIIQDLGETASGSNLTYDHVGETIGKIMSLLQHMAQTIDVFRGFYRPDKEKKVFSIKDSIDQALAFIAPAFRFQSIAVELDVDPGLTAFGYPKEYAQVLLNVLVNARDVFRTRETEKPRVIIRACAEGNKTVVTITDNGGGIPEAIMGRIFDFYFTTKESSGGTGIGLYMSKNIIEKNMGGTLSAENTDGGARFRIEIPPT